MAVSPRDKILIGAALCVALASAGLFGSMALRHQGGAGTPLAPVELTDSPYVSTAPDAPPIKTENWGLPVAQTRGKDWIYDTFTPPEIFYNSKTRQFTVKPPSSLVDDDPQEPFGLDLVAVNPEPFRLQLIGYVGGEGKWLGHFRNGATEQVFLGQAGWRDAKLGVSIKRFEVSRQAIRLAESMETRQLVATAVVQDEKAGREVTLTHRERVFTGTLTAMVAATGDANAREVRIGDVFKLGEATYRIEKIALTPPTIEVTKESPSLAQPDNRLLSPREPDESERPEGTPPSS